MRHLRSGLFASLLALAAAPSATEPVVELRKLREDARAAMKPCGHCHDATDPHAMSSALAAFDLHQTEWASALTPSKLGCRHHA